MAGENENTQEQKIWSDEDTKLLVSFRLAMEAEFISGRRKKSVLWGKLLSEIKTLFPLFPYDKGEIVRKFQNLKVSYQRIKKRNKQSGRDVSSWDYFEEFDRVYGTRHNIEPPDELVAEVFGQSDESDNDGEDVQETPTKKIKKNSKMSNTDIMTFLEKEAEEDERRHKEIISVEREKIKVEKQRLEVLLSLKEALERMSN